MQSKIFSQSCALALFGCALVCSALPADHFMIVTATTTSLWSTSTDFHSSPPKPTPTLSTIPPTDLYDRKIATPTLSPVFPRNSDTGPVYLPPSRLASTPVHAAFTDAQLSFMGQSHSKPKQPSNTRTISSWLATSKGILSNFGPGPKPTVGAEIPPDNIFVPIQTDNILPQVPISMSHPVPRKGVEDDANRTMHTNKFYANAFLGEQNQAIFTHPYSMWWGKGIETPGMVKTWGMCVSHVEESELAYGPGDPASVYVNPIHKQSLILSAKELDQQTQLTTDTHLPFSVNINLNSPSSPNDPVLTMPVVQGMSFITAGYRNALPSIQTGNKGFVDVSGPIMLGRSAKYRIKDMEGYDWIIYVNPTADVNYDPSKFLKLDPNTIIGPAGFKGTIQVAKNPLGAEGEAMYDRACGSFVTEAQLTAVVNDNKGTYSLTYSKIGASPLLMFGLPHHIQSLDPELRGQVTRLELRATTKHTVVAIWADKLSFTEQNLPVTMSFGPWINNGARPRYPPEVLTFIAAVAEQDLRRVMAEIIPPDSMYYAGKSLAKFATIIWVIKDVLSNDTLAATGLEKLKKEFGRYVANQQRFPLFYDDIWKGVVSNAGFDDPGADFGNTYYNDHHFHFGYFVYTTAVIGYLDPVWLTQGDNKEWTNMLVKDFAESDYDSRDFPFARSFDWWHGHSWAKGLFESADGKDQESTSEDAFASFAIKMWGKVIGDGNMEKRGNLMLAIQARSFNNYFYLQSNNVNHPKRFIGNKIAGILFENKVEYSTYFGNDTELVHGIHMVPLTPASQYTRTKPFVREEWDAKFSDGRANVDMNGWRGILYANLALIDPKASYAFFRDGIAGQWSETWIDGGASRTWYLVFAAALSENARR